MSYYYGYGRRHLEKYGGLKKKVDDLEEKVDELTKEKNTNYTTVFDINLKTAVKTFETVNGEKKLTQARNGKYCLFQKDKTLAPTFGDDFIENKGINYMCFCCPELQFPNISIFIVCEVADTSVSSTWAYLIGNDNGDFDKYISFKAYSYTELIVGGLEDATIKTINLPSAHSILHKHILSCHWLGTGLSTYANGVLIPGNSPQPDMTDIGSPFGSVFFNERFNDTTSALATTILKGKIYGFKIVVGLLLPADIVKINKDMIKEYGNFI